MTTDAELTRFVGSWLQEGRTRLPDHVLDAVLAEIPTTRQRRSWWPARRIAAMTPVAKFATAAAGVTVIAIAGVNVLQAPGPVGPSTPAVASPSPSPATSPSVAPSPSPAAAARFGPLASGRYTWPWEGGEVSFAVEDSWTASADGIARRTDTPGEYSLGPHLPGTPNEVTHIYADACQSAGQLEPVGPSVDDLVSALENQVAIEMVETGIKVGRAMGTRVEIRETPGLDRSACRHGADGPLQIWADAAEASSIALAPGYWMLVYAFDLDGRRLVFAGALGPETTDQAVMQLDDIIFSLDFGPPVAGPLPLLTLPGTTASPAGEYGWEGGPNPGSGAGMHKVLGGNHETALVFRVGPACLAGDGQEAVPVRVAGFDGVSIEPYQPPVPFGSPDGDEITRAHALEVGGRTLCVFLTWNPRTTDAERAAAEHVLDTLRAVPMGEDRVRITFMLDTGWDVG